MTTLRQRLTRALDGRSLKGVDLGPYDITIERDLRVPMDDGIELLADLIRPVGDDIPSLPTIVIRGPYGRSGPIAGFARALAYEGFTVLFQSCRGTWGSQGLFTPQIDEQRDGIATLRWVRKQPWFTGHLATYGQSYMGYTQWAVAGRMALDDPENASEALVLITTMPDFGAITWDNGAFALRNALGWTRMMHRMRRGGFALIGMALPDPQARQGVRCPAAERRRLRRDGGGDPLVPGLGAARGPHARVLDAAVARRVGGGCRGPRLDDHRLVRHLPALAARRLRAPCRGRALAPTHPRTMGTHVTRHGGADAHRDDRVPQGDLRWSPFVEADPGACLRDRCGRVARPGVVAACGLDRSGVAARVRREIVAGMPRPAV